MPRKRKGGGLVLIFAGAIAALAWSAGVLPLASPPPPAASDRPRPSWLHTMPIVTVSNHDDMPIFRRRVGGSPTWQEEDYEKEHTPEAIEELKELGVTDQGIMVNRIRTFKMTNTLHNTLFVASGGQDGSSLQLAEALAFGRQCIGDVGGVLAGYDLPQDQRRYLKFFHHNFDYYRDIDNVADVAVLHSYATTGFNNDRPAVSTMLFEQTLIQGKGPFDIIFDDNLKDLSKYRVLALTDQECLSDEQMDLIRKFVRGGGGLVVTEHTSLYTPWRQRRRNFGLKDLIGLDAPAWRGAYEPEPILKTSTHSKFGSGRVVYIPEVKAVIPRPYGEPMTSKDWKLPANWRELNEAVKWAAAGQLSLEVVAPLAVAAELTQQKQNKTLMVHLVNYNVAKVPNLRGIQLDVQLDAHQKVRKAFLLSPDEEAPRPLIVTEQNGRARISIPQLRTYALAVIQSE
jgi:hypothetical protein